MRRWASVALVAGIGLLGACAASRLERSLSPDHRDFLSKARYTVTREERRTFLNLPPSERDAFIQEFWKKRDPDPDTEENEFKEGYFQRIEEANRLFSAAGAPGWLQDRGRIYILLGQPDERETYPRGQSLYDPPSEVWYYGFFPIIFIDRNWTEDYILEPLSAMHIALINEAQMGRRPQFGQTKGALNVRIEIGKSKPGEVLVRATVLYKDIWFAVEGDTLKATLRLSLDICGVDSSGREEKKIREEYKDYPLVFQEKDWLELKDKAYVMEFAVSGLAKGTYAFQAGLRNEADSSQVYKKEIITL